MLNVHCDTQNPKEYDTLQDSFMNMPVACYSVKKSDERCALIGYGCNSVVLASLRYLRYHQCLQSVITFYNDLPNNQKNITTSLVDKLCQQVKEEEPARIMVHTNKMVY